MSAIPADHEHSQQHFPSDDHKKVMEALDDGLDDQQIISLLRKIKQKRAADTNTSDLRAGDADSSDKVVDPAETKPIGADSAKDGETISFPTPPPGFAAPSASGLAPTILLPVHEHGQSSSSASEAQSSSKAKPDQLPLRAVGPLSQGTWMPSLPFLPAKHGDGSSERSFSMLSTTSRASTNSKKSHKSATSSVGSFSVVSSGSGRGTTIEGDPAPMAWPMRV